MQLQRKAEVCHDNNRKICLEEMVASLHGDLEDITRQIESCLSSSPRSGDQIRRDLVRSGWACPELHFKLCPQGHMFPAKRAADENKPECCKEASDFFYLSRILQVSAGRRSLPLDIHSAYGSKQIQQQFRSRFLSEIMHSELDRLLQLECEPESRPFLADWCDGKVFHEDYVPFAELCRR